jgi:hypothetical protein
MLMIATYDQRFGPWVFKTHGDAASTPGGLSTCTVQMMSRYHLNAIAYTHLRNEFLSKLELSVS